MRRFAATTSLIVGLLTAAAAIAEPVTYQGRLDFQGQPFDGLADFRVNLHLTEIGGSPLDTVFFRDVDVADGLFQIVLDFTELDDLGDTPAWLSFEVRQGGIGSYTLLGNRQEITYAARAINANKLGGVDASQYLTGIPNPLSLISNNAFWAIRGENTATGPGIQGVQSNTGALNSAGVFGLSNANGGRGVYGQATDDTGRGMYGIHFNESGAGKGVEGWTYSNSSGAAGVSGSVLAGGHSSSHGVKGENLGNGIGVFGVSTDGHGVWGTSVEANGVVATSTNNVGAFATSVNDYGVYGRSTNETGILGQTNSTASNKYGVHGLVNNIGPGTGSAGVYGENNATNSAGYGVHGHHAGNGYAVYGRVEGSGRGVYGITGDSGYGVYGNGGSNGTGTYGFSGNFRGVYGTTNSGIGVEARAFSGGTAIYARSNGTGTSNPTAYIENTTNNGIAIFATADSADASTVFVNTGSGPVIKGFAGATGGDLVFQVGSDGITMAKVLQITGGSDLSEQFDVRVAANADMQAIEPGMVVCIDPDNPGKLIVSSTAHDRTVAGIISGANGVETGMMMGQTGTVADGKYPVALTGRVYVWCDADAGAIQPGDLLTTANTAGHAMKVTDHSTAGGAIIGKAMTKLESGRGLVLVLVSLQ